MYKSRMGNRRLRSNDLIVLVLISLVVAWPVALYFLQSCLQQYSCRINVGTGEFIQPTLIAALITMIIRSLHATKAAIANPVKSLRTE
jgi:putative ABC transport system permease protein